MHRWPSSPSARRISTRHCTSESSVTNVSAQMALINSSLVTSRLLFSTRYFNASNTFGLSLTSSPMCSRQARSKSNVKFLKEQMLEGDFVIFLAFFGFPFVTRPVGNVNYSAEQTKGDFMRDRITEFVYG